MRGILQRLPYVLIVAAVCVLVVGLRLNGFSGVPGKLLWAEDGDVFIKGAMERGLSAVVEPYAGYLHVYARIVASIAVLPNVRFLAYLMLFGWILGYVVAALFVVRALRLQGMQLTAALVVVVMCALTPTSGETLFNITNMQWHLGAALATIVLIPSARRPSIVEAVFIAVASLTGPFSIILLPLVALRSWWFRGAYQRQRVDLILLVCALIQLSFLVGSNRVNANISCDIQIWMAVLWRFITFGGQGAVAIPAALAFWLLYIFGLVRGLTTEGWHDVNLKASVLFLLASGLFLFAGLYAAREVLDAASPLGSGGRYFVIPYYLLMISTVFLSRHFRVLAVGLLLVLLVVDLHGFHRIYRDNYGYENFLEFASAGDNVLIPINPKFSGHQFGYRLWSGRTGSVKAQVREVVIGAVTMESPNQWSVNTSVLGCAADTHTLGLQAVFDLSKGGEIGAQWDGLHSSSKAEVWYSGRGEAVNLAMPWEQLGDGRLLIRAASKNLTPIRLNSLKAFCISS